VTQVWHFVTHCDLPRRPSAPAVSS
jgi:hypothetical protein